MYFVVGILRFQKWFVVDVLDLQVKPKKPKYLPQSSTTFLATI